METQKGQPLPKLSPCAFEGTHPALSAPAAGTAASWLPGTLLAGLFPADVWRNSSQVEHGEAVPRRTGGKSGVTGLTWHISFADWATPSEAPKAAEGRRPCTLRPRNRHLLSLDVSAKCCAPGLREGWSLPPWSTFSTPPRPGLHIFPPKDGGRQLI